MIDIISDKEKLLKSLRELEFEHAQGNISDGNYSSQKKAIARELETLEVADRVKRLQGKGNTERPLEYWEEKKKAEDAIEEKEELMKKFVTHSNEIYSVKNSKIKDKGVNKNRVMAFALLAVIFFSGIGFGVLLMKVPSESVAVPMTVNDSAFPTFNNTTNITEDVTEVVDTSTNTDTGTGTDTGGGGTGNTTV